MLQLSDLPAKRFHHKYDLMHLNSVPIASTVIEWDLGKLKAVSRNRVIRWLKEGKKEVMGGQASSIYHHLIYSLEVPRVTTYKYSDGRISYGLFFAPDYLVDAINEAVKASAVTGKLEGQSDTAVAQYRPVYRSQPHSWTYLYAGIPLDGVDAAIKRMSESDEYKTKVQRALDMVLNGEKLYFRYN